MLANRLWALSHQGAGGSTIPVLRLALDEEFEDASRRPTTQPKRQPNSSSYSLVTPLEFGRRVNAAALHCG
jgi:hypothetical protein